MNSVFAGLTYRLTITLLTVLLTATLANSRQTGIEQSRSIAEKATQPTNDWPLPPKGPAALAGKTIVYIGEDLRNAGILGVGTGVREAGAAIGWKVHFLDIGSKDSRRETIFKEALALKPNGLILGGMDGVANSGYLTEFRIAGIPIVGWHVAPFPGPVAGTPIQVNVTTDSLEVARVAAHFVIADSAGSAATVIFTDSRFAIALKKSETMAEVIRSCHGCSVLEVRDIALDKVTMEMPAATEALLKKYGSRWNYSLGINDLYFDHAIPALVLNGQAPDGPPFSISAGDGSPSAFLRIQNNSYQKATVPEPLLFHGWQLIDEMNRLLSGQGPSSYVTPPHIVTQANIWPGTDRINLFDPENGYREFYLHNWGRTQLRK
jgi:ribose transport system substrate-binding protein